VTNRRTDDATLIEAVRILSRTIQTDDGVIAACLAEVAARLAELVDERRSISTLLQKVESLEAENNRLREERRWVPVSERVSKELERVLLFDPTIPDFPRTNTHIVIGYFRGLDDIVSPWHSPDGRGPTHWMPLPPGPEGNG